MKRLLILIVLLLGASPIHAYECQDFESKTVRHSVDDLFCVSHDTKLTPMQMEGQYSINIESNKLTDLYDHKIVFDTKGVFLLKSSDNKILTVEVINPVEMDAWVKLQFRVEVLEETEIKNEEKIAKLTLEKADLNDDYIVAKSKLAEAEWIIDENQTVHDSVNANKKDLKDIYREVEEEKSKWEFRAKFLLAVLGLLVVNRIWDWAKANSQTGHQE